MPRVPAFRCCIVDRIWRCCSRPGASVFSFAALFAEPVDLESMASRLVMVLAPDLLLNPVHFRREEFHRGPAQRANHVMMAATVILMFEPRDSIMEGHLAR